MLPLVRSGTLWLSVYASICGVQANLESPNQTTTSSTTATSSLSVSSIRAGTPSATQVAGAATSLSTCPNRTINYITHTLAQQCLRADWTRSRTSAEHTTEVVPSSNDISTAASSDLSTSIPLSASSESSISTSHSAHAHTPATSSSTISIEPQISGASAEIEADSALDNANFLSFEEWKKQNLAKAGQSGDNIGSRKQFEPERRTPNVNALDSLGEESEIDLDFTGFGGPPARPDTQREQRSNDPSATTDGADIVEVSPASQALRPRDAGKTCKERTNYASFDCAATVLKSNQECKSASSVLVENKDSYMLNKCSASNKYFIVELCNDILVDTVVLANYEFFSSIFRTFRVSVSDRYPAKAEKWKDLGTFEARNTREVQAFLIENPLIWARYLRIEFLTHYGSEYYCPVSLLRVHGTTMMEEFRNQEELTRGDTQDDEMVVESTSINTAAPAVETIHNVSINDKVTSIEHVDQSTTPSVDIQGPVSLSETMDNTRADTKIAARDLVTTSPIIHAITSSYSTCPSDMSTTAVQSTAQNINTTSVAQSSSASSVSAASSEKVSSAIGTSSSLSSPAAVSSSTSTTAVSTSSISQLATSTSSVPSEDSQTKSPTPTTTASTTTSVFLQNTTAKDTSMKSSTTNSTKSATSAALQAQPSTQESFFKSISKRLQQLESNSTLSLQYIEEQSRILRDAFSKVEKRQISTTTSFLANLNHTVMAELTGFRQAYDQLWQSTVIELEGQREQHQREMTALSSRLTLVVDELVWQKRMGIVQSTLLLLCLGLVLFARPGQGTFEASIMQQVMSRSQAAFRSSPGSNDNSPPGGRSPVSMIRRKIWRTDAEAIPEQPDDVSLSPSPISPVDRLSPIENDLSEHDDVDSVYDNVDDTASEASLDMAQQAIDEEEFLQARN